MDTEINETLEIIEHNAITGEVVVRSMTEEEHNDYLATLEFIAQHPIV